jgi:hypothetical protein
LICISPIAKSVSPAPWILICTNYCVRLRGFDAPGLNPLLIDEIYNDCSLQFAS